jgi:hypothetical protein
MEWKKNYRYRWIRYGFINNRSPISIKMKYHTRPCLFFKKKKIIKQILVIRPFSTIIKIRYCHPFNNLNMYIYHLFGQNIVQFIYIYIQPNIKYNIINKKYKIAVIKYSEI